jgi:hypothetical protein
MKNKEPIKNKGKTRNRDEKTFLSIYTKKYVTLFFIFNKVS